jgi:hypothetical protein
MNRNTRDPSTCSFIRLSVLMVSRVSDHLFLLFFRFLDTATALIDALVHLSAPTAVKLVSVVDRNFNYRFRQGSTRLLCFWSAFPATLWQHRSFACSSRWVVCTQYQCIRSNPFLQITRPPTARTSPFAATASSQVRVSTQFKGMKCSLWPCTVRFSHKRRGNSLHFGRPADPCHQSPQAMPFFLLLLIPFVCFDLPWCSCFPSLL